MTTVYLARLSCPFYNEHISVYSHRELSVGTEIELPFEGDSEPESWLVEESEELVFDDPEDLIFD